MNKILHFFLDIIGRLAFVIHEFGMIMYMMKQHVTRMVRVSKYAHDVMPAMDDVTIPRQLSLVTMT